MTDSKRFSLKMRRGHVALFGLFGLIACFRGPSVAPSATLAPEGPDEGAVRTRGPFAVVYAAPRGKVTSRLQPGVTILFSRSMRAVDAADDVGVPAIGIRTQAGPVEGVWRWTGTRGLLFSPKVDLPGASDFVVTVPAGTRSLDGAVLEHPYTLELQTEGPRVLAVTAEGHPGISVEALPSDAGFRVDLDQPVDAAALEAASHLRVFAGDGDPGVSFQVHATLEASSALASAAHGVSILLKADKPLPLDRDVELSIAASLRGTGGPRPMAEKDTRLMRTHGPLRLVDFYCPRITSNGRCRAGGDVKLTFSTPVAAGELVSHLEGLPPPRPPGKNEKKTVGPKSTHWLGVAPTLGADYKIKNHRRPPRHLRSEARGRRARRAGRRVSAREASRRCRASRQCSSTARSGARGAASRAWRRKAST